MVLNAYFTSTNSFLPRSAYRHSDQRYSTVRASLRRDAGSDVAGRRDFLLKSSSLGLVPLASIFGLPIGPAERPSDIGLRDYGEGNKQLGLCPKSPPCISTAEVMNNDSFFVPPWTYNPEGGRKKKKAKTPAEAMAELKEVVTKLQPDRFEPTIIKESVDYLYVEYKSPIFGFIDDVEFYFPEKNAEVEYRSASRVGASDFDINRKRIRAIRKELEKKGWRSAGY